MLNSAAVLRLCIWNKALFDFFLFLNKYTKGAFLVRDNQVLNAPSVTHSAALHFTTLSSLACSFQEVAHSLRSLSHRTVEILKYVFTLTTCSTRTNAFLVVSRNTPEKYPKRLFLPLFNSIRVVIIIIERQSVCACACVCVYARTRLG